MTRYEYTVVYCSGGFTDYALNALGGDGWEVVSGEWDADIGLVSVLMKRLA